MEVLITYCDNCKCQMTDILSERAFGYTTRLRVTGEKFSTILDLQNLWFVEVMARVKTGTGTSSSTSQVIQMFRTHCSLACLRTYHLKVFVEMLKTFDPEPSSCTEVLAPVFELQELLEQSYPEMKKAA